jgi:hypothetical protein
VSYTKQKSQRKSIRSWLLIVEAAERDARFYFNQRHSWSEEGGGYAHCRREFLKARRMAKRNRARVVKSASRLVSYYVD